MYLPPSLPIKKGSLILLKIFSHEVQVKLLFLILENSWFRFFQLEKNPILFQIFEIFVQIPYGLVALFFSNLQFVGGTFFSRSPFLQEVQNPNFKPFCILALLYFKPVRPNYDAPNLTKGAKRREARQRREKRASADKVQ